MRAQQDPALALRLLACAPPERRERAPSAAQALDVARARLAGRVVEGMLVIVLDVHDDVLGVELVHIGGASHVDFRVAELVRAAVGYARAAKVWVAHNHPSGGIVPSIEDHDAARMMEPAFHACGLRFLGFLVVTDSGDGTLIVGGGL